MACNTDNLDRAENTLRRTEFRRDEAKETIFAQMNGALMQSHDQLMLERKDLPNYPAIFLFGLPRSGTTLLMQLFTRRFDVGYINNLIARFWRAPLYGITLSQQLLGDCKHSCFDSNYGKTPELAAPHEFAYFWHDWFNVHDMGGFDVQQIQNETDWEGLARLISNMAYRFGGPIAFKGLWPAYAMTALRKALPESFFVYIKRDPEDVALSLYHARMAYYGDPNKWWSMYPPEYKEVLHGAWHEQIAGQVYYLTRWYEQQFAQLPENCQATLSYGELCNAPRDVMDRLQEKIYRYTGDQMKSTHDIPARFNVRQPDRSFEGVDKLVAAVQRFFGKEEISQ